MTLLTLDERTFRTLFVIGVICIAIAITLYFQERIRLADSVVRLPYDPARDSMDRVAAVLESQSCLVKYRYDDRIVAVPAENTQQEVEVSREGQRLTVKCSYRQFSTEAKSANQAIVQRFQELWCERSDSLLMGKANEEALETARKFVRRGITNTILVVGGLPVLWSMKPADQPAGGLLLFLTYLGVAFLFTSLINLWTGVKRLRRAGKSM